MEKAAPGIKKLTGFALLFGAAIIAGSAFTVEAQWPEEAVLPKEKGAWALDQNYKTNIGGSYKLGYVRVIVLSNAKVFHRKFFDNNRPATPWCQVIFTDEDMRGIRSAVAGAKPGKWQPQYGKWLGLLAPFRKLVFTTTDAKGELIDYTTMVYQEFTMTPDVAKIATEIDKAGNLAFSTCAQAANAQSAPEFEKK